MHRIDNKPMGAYLQPAPQPKMPVRAKLFAKSKLKEIRATAGAPTPTTAQWLGLEDSSSSGSEEREAGPPIDPS
eukprot:2205277-Karenia_brevis.AAC.1